MPEARDRLSRPNDAVVEMYSRRRRSISSIGILPDDDDNKRSIIRTPFRWGATPLTGGGSGQRPMGETPSTGTTITGGVVAGRGLFGTPSTVYRRGRRSQNTPPSGGSFRRGRGGRSVSNSVLPYWYPRTPLGDITHVVQAIERRRERLGVGEGHLGSPTPSRIHQAAAQDPSALGAQLEHDISVITPKPKVASKAFKFADVANKGDHDSEFLTPQKLLDSIDIVEKVVMEQLLKLKRTPTAKKAEREKRVRTLMSMR